MNFTIKVGEDGGGFSVYPCSHYNVTTIHEECEAVRSGGETPGIRLILSEPSRVVRLPADGSVVYVMDAARNGETIDTYRWPLRHGNANQKEVA